MPRRVVPAVGETVHFSFTMEQNEEQLHNARSLWRCIYLVALLARQWMKERGIIYICVSTRSIYLVARLALGSAVDERTSTRKNLYMLQVLGLYIKWLVWLGRG